jgi:hypothetical protein
MPRKEAKFESSDGKTVIVAIDTAPSIESGSDVEAYTEGSTTITFYGNDGKVLTITIAE